MSINHLHFISRSIHKRCILMRLVQCLFSFTFARSSTRTCSRTLASSSTQHRTNRLCSVRTFLVVYHLNPAYTYVHQRQIHIVLCHPESICILPSMPHPRNQFIRVPQSMTITQSDCNAPNPKIIQPQCEAPSTPTVLHCYKVSTVVHCCTFRKHYVFHPVCFCFAFQYSLSLRASYRPPCDRCPSRVYVSPSNINYTSNSALLLHHAPLYMALWPHA